MIGNSSEMSKVKLMIQKAAPTKSTVLITGESGVGKELVARAIHNNSPRKDMPMVAVNCSALSKVPIPEISAVPPVITVFTDGALIIFPS